MAATVATLKLFLLYLFWISLLFLSGSLQLCIEKERKALLNVRSGFPDLDRQLSPWKGDECCSWERVGCNNITGHVIKLDFSIAYGLSNTSEVHPSLFHLKHLKYLNIIGNNLFAHQIPSSIGSLTQLQYLDLSYCGFGGEIPNQLGNLSNLRYLSLVDNVISGKIPASFVHLRNLQFVDLRFNNISGEIPEAIGNLRNIEDFFLSYNQIEGLIPKSIGNLSKMSDLDLSNNIIVGGLPETIGNITALQNLDLEFNYINGKIPDSIGNLHHLEDLSISSNNMSGSIPGTLGKLSALKNLRLFLNNLVGDITESHFANLTNLDSMDVSYNNLSDKVSEDWLPPFHASYIGMSSCNLGLRFPPWLRNQTSLQMLDISNNEISYAFPDWFWSLCLSNIVLNVSHNHMRGTLPHSLECFKNITTLDLSYNNFEGLIPGMQQEPWRGYFDLSHNLFSGPIPSSLVSNAGWLFLSNNNLNGSIPYSICTTNYSSIIDLADNGLSGTLPDCFTAMSGLMIFDVSNNKLSGRIPSTLGFLWSLRSLHFSNNNFSGTIPATLMRRGELVVIDFSYNELSGDIRSWIGPELSSLRVLSLRSNKFTGGIPSELSLSPSLQVLDLSHNLFSGLLPPSFGNFTAMMKSQNNETPSPLEVGIIYYAGNYTIFAKDSSLNFDNSLSLVMSIDLSNNNLSGMIPEELTNLHGLRYFNLSSNYFSGHIPEKIGLMDQLESLDFSMNNLSGRIPSSISKLTFLVVLNLSYNNLVGKIPMGPQLQTFTNLSYIKNPELCGEPLETKCPGDNQTNNDGITKEEDLHEDEHERIWCFIGFAPGFVFGFWGFMGAIMIKKSIRIKYILFIDSIIDWFMHM